MDRGIVVVFAGVTLAWLALAYGAAAVGVAGVYSAWRKRESGLMRLVSVCCALLLSAPLAVTLWLAAALLWSGR